MIVVAIMIMMSLCFCSHTRLFGPLLIAGWWRLVLLVSWLAVRLFGVRLHRGDHLRKLLYPVCVMLAAPSWLWLLRHLVWMLHLKNVFVPLLILFERFFLTFTWCCWAVPCSCGNCVRLDLLGLQLSPLLSPATRTFF